MVNLLERLKSELSDRYEIDREIGRGGMATVYLAADIRHSRQVAIKVLHPELAANVGAERFLQEIRTVARLNHPHVLPVHDSGEAAGTLFYVMPYVEGESLRQRLDRNRQLSIEETVRVGIEVADALDYAHRQGVVHRDIKPGNILLSEGHAVLADFGIARAVSVAREDRVTRTGLGVGTPLYSSPEQATADETLDGRTDIYSLGVVLYEMLAGEVPLGGATPQSIQAKRLSQTPTPLPVLRDTVPPLLDEAIARALARVPADRFDTASDFGEALVSASTDATSSGVYVTAAKPSGSRRKRMIIAAAVAAVAAVAAIFVWTQQPDSDSPGVLSPDPNAIAALPFAAVGSVEVIKELASSFPLALRAKITGEYGPRTVDPGLVQAELNAAEARTGEPLVDAAVNEVARSIGAAMLIRGTVMGSEDAFEIQAELVDARSGEILSRSIQRGAVSDWLSMLDRLVVDLLSPVYGETANRIPELARYKSEAVMAYLAGRRGWNLLTPGHEELFREALRSDSTLVLAALFGYLAGEQDRVLAEYAWRRREVLSPRDQLILTAGAGHLFGVVTSASEEMAAWETVLELEPDNFTAQYELAELLWNRGVELAVPDRVSRTKDLLERALNQLPKPEHRWLTGYRFEVALLEDDSASLVRQLASFDRIAGPGTRRRGQARAFGLSIGPSSDEFGGFGSGRETRGIIEGALLTGRSLDLARAATRACEVERCNEGRVGRIGALLWGWYDLWREALSVFSSSSDLSVHGGLVRDAVYIGWPDATVSASVGFLEDLAQQDPSSTVSIDDLAAARCWLAQWDLSQRRTERVPETIRFLRQDVPVPAFFSSCAALLETWLLRSEGQPHVESLLALDSLMRAGPLMQGPVLNSAINLQLARWLREDGDYKLGVEATLRGRSGHGMGLMWNEGYDIVLLREEAPLLALVGDTIAALESYERFLAFREQARGPWETQLDSVRSEYVALLAEVD